MKEEYFFDQKCCPNEVLVGNIWSHSPDNQKCNTLHWIIQYEQKEKITLETKYLTRWQKKIQHIKICVSIVFIVCICSISRECTMCVIKECLYCVLNVVSFKYQLEIKSGLLIVFSEPVWHYVVSFILGIVPAEPPGRNSNALLCASCFISCDQWSMMFDVTVVIVLGTSSHAHLRQWT